MVANQINPDISFFMGLMYSPLIGDKNVINGHALYNAMLRWSDIKADNINKISFGIPQNDPVTFKGFNKYHQNTIEEPKNPIMREGKIIKKAQPKTVLDNINKGYEGFTVLRSIENILTNPLYDFSPIPFEIIHTMRGQRMIAHKIDYFIFYIVWKGTKPDTDFTNTEFSIGMGRNNGFGLTNIERVFNTNMDAVTAGVPEHDKFTAINGIMGIFNHTRYGFGEYVLDTMNTGQSIMKLTTPLCLNSTYPNATQYGALPSHVKPVPYTKSPYILWDKGVEQTLQVIKPGKAFEIQEQS